MKNLEDAWELKKVLIKGSRSSEKSKLVEIERAENNIREILQKRPPVSLKDLAVNGKDLFELGYKEGKVVREILKKFLNMVIDRLELNKKEFFYSKLRKSKKLRNRSEK